MMVKKDALIDRFSDICVNNLSEVILEKCVEICAGHDLDEEALVDTWTAFSAMHLGFVAPTVDTLLRMEKEMLQKTNKQRKQNPPDSKKKSTTGKDNINLTLPTGYKTPQRVKPESRATSLEIHDVDSPAVFSPTSFSPAIFTPSRKPASAGSGKVVCEYGGNSEADWQAGEESKVVVEQLPTGAAVLSGPQLYMFEPVHLSRAVLCDHIDQLGAALLKKNDLPESSPINEPAMEEVTVVGRVACDAEDNKLTASSVVLVGANEREEVSVSLQKVPSYALFPGQVVAAKTFNETGKQLLVSQFYSDLSPPLSTQSLSFSTIQGPIQIVIASGPFTHSDAMTYEPLLALLEYINQHKPHVLILIGPFLDESHQSVQKHLLENTFEAFFNELVQKLLLPIESLHTQVVLVASARDAHHYTVYPTPPYTFPGNKPANLTLASDPCLLSINGLVVGVTATDVLMHLGRCEVASQSSDRLARLASHVLHQATFYPLYPPPQQLSLHLELWEKFAQMPVKPHVLVLPSDLRCFVKELEGSVVVNPERLTKGVGGGSFARLEIHEPQEDKTIPESIRAQVVKI